MRTHSAIAALIAATMLGGGAQALDAADKCGAAKNKIAGKYAFCRQKAEAKSIKSGNPVDYSKCDSKFALKWGIGRRTAGACARPTAILARCRPALPPTPLMWLLA